MFGLNISQMLALAALSPEVVSAWGRVQPLIPQLVEAWGEVQPLIEKVSTILNIAAKKGIRPEVAFTQIRADLIDHGEIRDTTLEQWMRLDRDNTAGG